MGPLVATWTLSLRHKILNLGSASPFRVVVLDRFSWKKIFQMNSSGHRFSSSATQFSSQLSSSRPPRQRDVWTDQIFAKYLSAPEAQFYLAIFGLGYENLTFVWQSNDWDVGLGFEIKHLFENAVTGILASGFKIKHLFEKQWLGFWPGVWN